MPNQVSDGETLLLHAAFQPLRPTHGAVTAVRHPGGRRSDRGAPLEARPGSGCGPSIRALQDSHSGLSLRRGLGLHRNPCRLLENKEHFPGFPKPLPVRSETPGRARPALTPSATPQPPPGVGPGAERGPGRARGRRGRARAWPHNSAPWRAGRSGAERRRAGSGSGAERRGMAGALTEVLGEVLVAADGEEVAVSALAARGVSLVGLYFGCSLSGPCAQLGASLAAFYGRFRGEAAAAGAQRLEIVFVSAEQEQQQWQEAVRAMPWLALPFAEKHRKVRTGAGRRHRGGGVGGFVRGAAGPERRAEGERSFRKVLRPRGWAVGSGRGAPPGGAGGVFGSRGL